MVAPRNIPSSPPKTQPTLKNLFDQDLKCCIRKDEILSIISFCSSPSTVMDPLECPPVQSLKRSKLNQLLSIVKLKKPLHDDLFAPLVSMISINLFRPLPTPSNAGICSDFPDDEGPISTFSPTWSDLQIVYDIVLGLVINIHPSTLQEHVNNPFLLNLLALFKSEDPRERDSLKNLFHRIYLRFTFHRSFMRKSMNEVFLDYIFDAERHCGIGELLEIYGSIINGFTVPLKEEHKLFLMRVLIPMHKTKGMLAYHHQLAYCVSQFVQKEPALGGVVVRGILRYWPVTSSQKEIMIIGELEELVENLDPDQYRKLALPLCSRITKCLNSSNSEVAERALYVWNNEQFVKMATAAIEDVFPVVVEGMEKNLKSHWCKTVRQLTENVKAMLEEYDPVLYCKCVEEIPLREYEARQEEIERKKRWERIETAAARGQFLQLPRYICA